MKKIKVLLFIGLMAGFSLNTDASCQKAYKAYKRATLSSPVTAPSISSTHLAEGSLSTTGNLLYGILRADTGLMTAGAANGIAFSYEGHFYIELMSSNFRHYRGRSKVLDILNQAELGMGEELEDLLEDLNESFEDEELDFFTLVEIINEANQKKVFCPANKELFTLKNLKRYILGL